MTDTNFFATNHTISNAALTNSNPTNWVWSEQRRAFWTSATLEWQAFAEKWRDAEEALLYVKGKALDLSSVPDNTLPESVLIRECYLEAAQEAWKYAVRHPATGAIFTGQPGIGKSVFVWYLLVCLLQRKQIVLFYTPEIGFMLFYHDGVYAAPQIQSFALPIRSTALTPRPFIWSLFDIGKQTDPPEVIWKPRVLFPVFAPSPSEDRYKLLVKERHPLFTGFPLWDDDEILSAASLMPEILAFQECLDGEIKRWKDIPASRPPYSDAITFLRAKHGEDAPKSKEEALKITLLALIDHFGPIPRDIFSAIDAFHTEEDNHERALPADLAQLRRTVHELVKRKHFPNTGSSHRIISLAPTGKVGSVIEWRICFKSTYIGKRASMQLVEEEENEARDFVRHFSSFPTAKGLAGSFFEPFVHRRIVLGGGGNADQPEWPLRKMTLKEDTKSVRFFLHDPTETKNGFSKIKRKSVTFFPEDLPERLSNDEYYVAHSSTHLLFDSFIVEADFSDNSAHLWLLQMTTAVVHKGSHRQGYPFVRNIVRKVRELFDEGRDSGQALLVEETKESGQKLKMGENADQVPPAKKTKTARQNATVKVHYVLVRPAGKKESHPQWVLPEGWSDSAVQIDHRGDGYLLDYPLDDLNLDLTSWPR